ncbi:uncharacterized protein LOC143853528 isoform X2 [Tasmannia lanceolata]|uniref:uncharacterized protein LOC143853528 isoform X2 n=1 Tax=Tasmannia lanceolata TaxID=3420 RepID=UPI004062B679
MGFNLVFRSLQEVFPQVDVRVLRAVAIEHSKDVNAAVEFILFEILPTMCTPQDAKHTVSDNQEPMHSLVGEEAVEANAGPYSKTRSIACEDAGGINHKNDTSCINSTFFDELVVGSHAAPSSMTHEDTVISDLCSDTSHANIQESHGLSVYNSKSALITDVCSHSCSDINSPKEGHFPTNFQHFQSPFYDESVESIDRLVVAEIGVSASLVECEELGSRSSPENGSERVTFDSELTGVDDASFPTTIATRSGQITSTDFLEEFIEDAKNNKKTLSLAMESVTSMVEEVVLQEEAAEQAKKQASEGGLDILIKVEDLKQMLQHAKEANNMHAGEVYGERAILATEARELQSRLLNLSDARDTSLSIIDEMRRDLEARLAVARAEKEAAEQEKLDKEKSAHKALTEQELIMENVVEGSKKLQQEAEENAKLREFLIDRGRVVYTLRGEIAVICEDVKSLKEEIDRRLPMKKSLSKSQTSSTLASSSTSLKSIPADQGLERTKSSKSLESSMSLKSKSSTTKSAQSSKSTRQEPLNSGQSKGAKRNQKEKKPIGDGPKASSSRDGWDWFYGEAELPKGAKHNRKEKPTGDGPKASASWDGWDWFFGEAQSSNGAKPNHKEKLMGEWAFYELPKGAKLNQKVKSSWGDGNKASTQDQWEWVFGKDSFFN